MGKLITAIVMVGIGVVIFFVPTRALLDKAKPIEAERDDFKAALDQAQVIKAKRDELEKKRSQFDFKDEQALDKFLPDTVDSVRLIVEIKDIVRSKPGLILQDISVSDKKEELTAALKAVGFSSTKLSFVVKGDYFAFKDLMRDLERSLRIVDVVALDISYDDVTKDQEFSVTLRTYWISSPQENV
jgi:hypothetical protein